MLQRPYKDVFFEIVGNEEALNFFLINELTGEIKLKTSLLQDPRASDQYQVQVRLRDGGTPPKVSDESAALNVRVTRNLNTPEFLDLPYTAKVRKDLGFGNSVAKVTAEDRDAEVSMTY